MTKKPDAMTSASPRSASPDPDLTATRAAMLRARDAEGWTLDQLDALVVGSTAVVRDRNSQKSTAWAKVSADTWANLHRQRRSTAALHLHGTVVSVFDAGSVVA